MENIAQSTLEQVAKEISEFIDKLEHAIGWAAKYLKDSTRKSTSYELKKARRNLKRIQFAITQRPSAALFGESQVGKSYLIKTFLSDHKGEFLIFDPSSNQHFNFLEEINPRGGGVESTSVVSRFSTRVKSPNPEFPLIGKLLSAKEVILLLCDTYFNDVKNHLNLPKKEEVQRKVEDLEEKFGSSPNHQTYLTEDDIYDIKEYLEEHFSSFIQGLADTNYWDVVAMLIHRINPDSWFAALNVVFGGNEFIEGIFNKLIEELKKLGFSTKVFLEFKSVLRKHGTLLNVARLRELNADPMYEDVVVKEDFMDSVLLTYKEGDLFTRRKVDKSTLCALLAEITFSVDQKKEEEIEFLINSDLLDFPGAQPRLKNNEQDMSTEHIGLMVLRGKVGYLFNRYSSQYLINNLLLCHHNRDVKAKSIPEILNTWINNFIGRDAKERQELLDETPVSPLFKVFTYFNMDLAFDIVNDKDPTTYPSKWMKRFKTIFEDQIVEVANYKWNSEWSVKEDFFQNNYLLRDYFWSKEIFSDFEEKGKEGDFLPIASNPKYYEELKTSFINSPLVNQYFADPNKSWDEAAMPNKDGSEWILENLTKVGTNYSKTKKFIRDLNKTCESVLLEINKHFHSDAADKRIVKAQQKAGAIQLDLDIVSGVNRFVFGNFIKQFIIKESNVYEFYRGMLTNLSMAEMRNFNEYVLIRKRCEGLSSEKEFEENLEIVMAAYNFRNKEDAIRVFTEEKGINLDYLFYGDDSISIKNNSEILAESIKDYWFENYLVKERFQFLLDMGFKEIHLEDLFDNMKASFNKLNIEGRIAASLRDYVDRIENIEEAKFMIADITAGIINRFITSMGWDYYESSEVEKIRETNSANDLKLNFEFAENAIRFEDNEDISELFDQMRDYNNELNKVNVERNILNRFPDMWNLSRWSELMEISFVANCDIPTYDVKANTALGGIILELQSYRFNLNNY